jgi:hypothetical protein
MGTNVAAILVRRKPLTISSLNVVTPNFFGVLFI